MLVVVESLCDSLGQRYVPPKTERQAINAIRDLAIRVDSDPIVLPAGRCFGIRCPRCRAEAGRPCRDVRSGRELKTPHAERRSRNAKQQRSKNRSVKAGERWAKAWSRQQPRGRK